MSATSKPRPDSVLKTLPEDRQFDIIQEMKKKGMTYHKVAAWLRADGIETSPAALSRFWDWWHLRQQLRSNETTVEQLMAELAKENPSWSPERIQEIGQSFFTAMALQAQDPKQWFFIQKLALQKQQLAFERDKFEFDASKAALKIWPSIKQISSDKTLSETDKVQAVRQKLFGFLPK